MTSRSPSHPVQDRFGAAEQPESRRDLLTAMRRGAMGRCPHCGEGRLFRAYLKVADNCSSCGTEFHHHRADDLPAYVVIAIVGHVVIGGLLSVESYSEWPVWIHAVLWPLLTIVLTLGLLPPVKGAIVGLQWALRMHGFAGRGETENEAEVGSAPDRGDAR